MLIYFIVFGDTMSSILCDLSDKISPDDFFGSRKAYVIILSLLLVPLVIKKELQELKIISVFLFITIFGFIFITIEQLGVHGVKKYNRDFD